jgi:precorrin-6B methylase 2
MELVTFCGLGLLTAVGRVMVPRPASEGVAAAAIALAGDRPVRVVDVGTGSGAIALAVAAALPQAEVFATDTSPAAVALARANARRLGLAGRVTVLRGDLLEPVPGAVDLILANLPYLPAAEARRRPELGGEPSDAVFAAGDGLGPYRRLVAASRGRLTSDGALVLQLHRRVLATRRDELDGLAAALDSGGRSRPPGLLEGVLDLADVEAEGGGEADALLDLEANSRDVAAAHGASDPGALGRSPEGVLDEDREHPVRPADELLLRPLGRLLEEDALVGHAGAVVDAVVHGEPQAEVLEHRAA